jgi:hypothetical protein
MKKTLVALAVLGACVATSAARADSYARAYNEVSNLVVTVSSGVSIGATVDTSFANACLPNGNCVSKGGVGFTDSPAAQIGWAGYVNNSYASNEGAPGSYSVADASIDAQQLTGSPSTRARSFAEAQLVGNGTASASAGNSSATLLSTTLTAGAGDTLSFRFDANPYIKSWLSSSATAPSQAEAAISLNFNLIDSNGNVVFNWAPDGVAGGILGGTETADAYTLNTALTAVSGNPGPLIFAPTSCAAGSATGCFSATTNGLAAGLYTLNLSMHENVGLQSVVAAVPEPSTYLMMFAGMTLLGAIARRKPRK